MINYTNLKININCNWVIVKTIKDKYKIWDKLISNYIRKIHSWWSKYKILIKVKIICIIIYKNILKKKKKIIK